MGQPKNSLPASDAAALAQAFGALATAGYPGPGDSGGDATVAALWSRAPIPAAGKLLGEPPAPEWLALVELSCFDDVPVLMGVLVCASFDGLPLGPGGLGPHALKAMADIGRDSFRYDFLAPHAAVVR